MRLRQTKEQDGVRELRVPLCDHPDSDRLRHGPQQGHLRQLHQVTFWLIELLWGQLDSHFRATKLEKYSSEWISSQETIKDDHEVVMVADTDNDLNSIEQEGDGENEASSSRKSYKLCQILLLYVILLCINIWIRIMYYLILTNCRIFKNQKIN